MNLLTTVLLILLISMSGYCEIHSIFPKTIDFTRNEQPYHLELTGTTSRKKFFIKIYKVASYIDSRADKSNLREEIMKDAYAKQLTVKWTFDAALSRVRKGYLDSFREALTEGEYNALKEDIIRYLGFLKKDIKRGDEHILRWLPGGYVETVINGKTAGNITNVHFAKALWTIWFSGDSAANGGSLLN